MSVVLFRVDERLIHGQVVVGWGSVLHPERIVVVDDELAGSGWEQDLYCLGLPPDVESSFVTVAAARGALQGWQQGRERVLLLTRTVAAMLGLARGGLLRNAEVNIGGIHHAPGRRQALPYVFLAAEEEQALRQIAAEGATVTARDLPTARGVGLEQLLKGGR
jgi:mannose/fructose/N-acetylgalactosamine-specific phosphotransferase system component IIB